jgi:serine/threonine protein kinase/CHASE1-domain containing sensor protein
MGATQRTRPAGASTASGGAGRSSWLSVAVVLFVGLSLTIATFVLLRDRQSALQQAMLSERVTSLGARLGETFAIPLETARSAAALFAASERVTRDEFRRFVVDARARAPHVHAFEWAPLIAASDRAAFEVAARAELGGDYTIREPGSDGALVGSPARAIHAPLLFQEPPGRGFGIDMAASPDTRGALDRACVDDTPVTSGRRRLSDDDGAIVAAIAFVPAWRRGAVPADAGERCRTVLGYVSVVFDVSRAVETVLATAPEDLEAVVRDLEAGPGADLMFGTSPSAGERIDDSAWRTRRTFRFVDRTWAIDVAPATEPVAWMPSLVLILGIVATVLAAALAGGVRQILDLRRQVYEARSFGQYFLEEEIGRGGMGVVYRARHALMQRATAIKLVSPDSGQPNLLRQFEREVHITSQLSHPNTIAIYDYGHTREGEFYYVMEFVDGITFEQLVVHDGAQPVARTIHLVRQVCEALREAHQLGVVHRDLKPANLMITSRGGAFDFVKVLDFGLVKKMDPADGKRAVDAGTSGTTGSVTDASRLASTVRTAVDRPQPPRHDDTLEGHFLGTAGYASPEAVVGGVTDARSDLYAVGAVWFSLITGKPAFDDGTAMAIFAAQLREQPPRPSSLVAGVPPVIDDLVSRCLHRDPGQRPQSVDEVLTALSAEHLPQWSPKEADAWWRDRADAVRTAVRSHREDATRRTPAGTEWRREVARDSRAGERTHDTRPLDPRPRDRRVDTRRTG